MALRDFPILAAANIRSVGLFPYIETQNSKDCTVMLGSWSFINPSKHAMEQSKLS